MYQAVRISAKDRAAINRLPSSDTSQSENGTHVINSLHFKGCHNPIIAHMISSLASKTYCNLQYIRIY